MTDIPPPAHPQQHLGIVFWVLLGLPVALIVLTMMTVRSGVEGVFLSLVGLSALTCPVYCGFRLAFRISDTSWGRFLVGVALTLGLFLVYLAIFFAGCVASM